ncbi:hypothetical protein WA026_010542 [Henosepilachna vigintioctopunctata]|uniref:5'-nucleotidase domain-containing protein 1 n=1 Tax=Henosepilachna vigintioctopunctata TaxID=420089 RepID=A0AAW1V445_9CUCU
MEPGLFRFSDYDCIGFDLDNTLARYKIRPLVDMEYELIVQFLVKKGYSGKHLTKPINYDFLLRGLILDLNKGNILKLSEDGKIISACHGTRLMTKDELEKYYPNSHWEPTDVFTKDPLQTWNGPYSEKMRSILDYYDTVVSLIFARLVDTLDEDNKGPLPNYTIYSDIYDCFVEMFSSDNFQSDKSTFYAEIKSNPEKYYYKCSKKLLSWLKSLRKQGKLLYLLTNSHVDFASFTASCCIGSNWQEYFDIVITHAKKPGFFITNRDFQGLKETVPISGEQLKLHGVYSNGNWTVLREFFIKQQPNVNQRFLFVGDNLIEDIHTHNVYTTFDTVAICEELAEANHPDKSILHSNFWGSYFQDTEFDTIWYKIMKNHAKMWFPNMEFIANQSCEIERI